MNEWNKSPFHLGPIIIPCSSSSSRWSPLHNWHSMTDELTRFGDSCCLPFWQVIFIFVFVGDGRWTRQLKFITRASCEAKGWPCKEKARRQAKSLAVFYAQKFAFARGFTIRNSLELSISNFFLFCVSVQIQEGYWVFIVPSPLPQDEMTRFGLVHCRTISYFDELHIQAKENTGKELPLGSVFARLEL